MIVFTDTFTVSADTNIDAYPSGTPNYAYAEGGGSDLTVEATQDRVQPNALVLDTVLTARITNAAVPSTDQEIILFGNCDLTLNTVFPGPCVRMKTDNTPNYYHGEIDNSVANEVRIYRTSAGTATLIASANRSLSADAVYQFRLRATGTNPVALTLQIDATAAVTFNDSNAARKQTGTPGIFDYQKTGFALTPYIDNLTVDNLLAGSQGGLFFVVP